ncbi:unnamed protein product [Trifolium pratense]|uniref:Uncharacterized protein n=1 Tax=Trifolium pratense TaxID=57577 RepID=A0ACB0I9T0_TRIPR|nr:unnamed protein product [Trifolium pratense]
MDSNFDSKPPKGRNVKFQPKAPPRRVPKIEVKSVSFTCCFWFWSSINFFQIIWFSQKRRARPAVVKIQHSMDLYSDYPLVLPLKKPYSGNPEYLNEEEFGEAAESRTYDESTANSAIELGLLEENPEASAFFMKLPPVIPMIKKVQDVKENVKRPGGPRGSAKLVRLNELPAGFIGKMIVYKSGKVKLKHGDTLYDVSSGMNCIFSQELVAMNATEKHCCTIGEINALATVTPDIDAALDCLSDLDL